MITCWSCPYTLGSLGIAGRTAAGLRLLCLGCSCLAAAAAATLRILGLARTTCARPIHLVQPLVTCQLPGWQTPLAAERGDAELGRIHCRGRRRR